MGLMEKRAPGRRIIKRLSLQTKYWLVGGASAVLIGTGLAILMEASQLKAQHSPLMQWFLMGTYGFTLTIGGLGLMQISTRYRVMIDVRKLLRRELKKVRKSRNVAPRKDAPKKQNPAD